MTKKYLIETFGCQMNVLDSEKIAGNLNHNGMESTRDASLADIIVLNTCSVREKAVQKVYGRLGDIKTRKVNQPNLVVCVVGCMAQLEKERILKKAPFVNVLAGPQKGHSISALVERSITAKNPIIDMRLDDEPAPLETENILRPTPWRVGITISEGCSRHCTYCVVPITRGKERARKFSNILQEVENLVCNGCVEILLLGQTVNSYADPTDPKISFAELLRRTAQIPGLKRIRFLSPHPRDFTDELLEVMVSCPQVCNHIHLPVQSGSTKILRAMGRGYTREDYLEIIRKIHLAERPIAISTDFIVGYPGESEPERPRPATVARTAIDEENHVRTRSLCPARLPDETRHRAADDQVRFVSRAVGRRPRRTRDH